MDEDEKCKDNTMMPSSHSSPPRSWKSNLRNLMFDLAEHGFLNKFKILDSRVDLINDRDCNGNSYLHRAARDCRGSNKEGMLRYILNVAPQLTEVRNTKGETALFLACQTNTCLQSIKDIVKCNPKCVTIPDDAHKSALCQYIEKVDPRETPESDSWEVIELLLMSRIDVNAEHGIAQNALITTLMKRNMSTQWIIAIIDLLFAHGVNVRSISHATHVLEFVTNPTIARVILNHDSSGLNTTDFCGYTTLHRIMKRNAGCSIELLQCLAKYGATLGPKNDLNTYFLLLIKCIDRSNQEVAYIKQQLSLLTLDEAMDVFKFLFYLIDNIYKYNDQVCINLFEYFLNMSVFKNTSNCNVLEFYKDIIIYIYKLKDKIEIRENMLKIIINSNSLVSDMHFYILSFVQEHLFLNDDETTCMDMISYIIMFHYNKTIPQFIKMMINAGFIISKRDENDINPMTALISIIREHESTKEFKETFLLLIDLGVNLESWSMFLNVYNASKKHRIDILANYKIEMLIPDALYLYINTTSSNKEVLIKLLSHWWAPPLALLTFAYYLHRNRHMDYKMYEIDSESGEYENIDQVSLFEQMSEETSNISEENHKKYKSLFKRALKRFDAWFKILANYGGIPHGTNMFKKLDDIMWLWHKCAICANMEDSFKPYITRYKQLSDTPISLQELCKYAVRRSLAEKALQHDANLPALLHEFVPTRLHTVVIH